MGEVSLELEVLSTGVVPLGLEVLSKILGPFLKQGVDHLLGHLLLHDSRGRGHLLPLSLSSLRHLGSGEERTLPQCFNL